MSHLRLTYLFNKYINKELTAEENIELFRLIETEEIDEELKGVLDKLIDDTGGEILLPENSGEKILQAIVGDMPALTPEMPFNKKRILHTWIKIAAASVILIGLFTFLFFDRDKTGKTIQKNAVVQTGAARLLHAATTTREGRNVKLPDNTEVWLSPSSTIEYPASFTGSLREVKLSGEAFFEVAHDATHPFVIYSGNIETKVLGTSFNIQAYDNQEEINVTVVTGKVNVTHKNKSEHIELIANERAVFHRKTTALIKEETNTIAAPTMLKRKEGEFVYKGERLQKVMDDLHEYFGITINVASSVKECPISFNVYLTDKIEEILEPIAISINGNIQKHGEVYFIDGKACPDK